MKDNITWLKILGACLLFLPSPLCRNSCCGIDYSCRKFEENPIFLLYVLKFACSPRIQQNSFLTLEIKSFHKGMYWCCSFCITFSWHMLYLVISPSLSSIKFSSVISFNIFLCHLFWSSWRETNLCVCNISLVPYPSEINIIFIIIFISFYFESSGGLSLDDTITGWGCA